MVQERNLPRVIQRLRRVNYSAYADFPADNRRGDLAYATDRLVLYRWSGSAWQRITIHSSSGAAAAIPTAADLPNGSLYFETDTLDVKQVQAGAWVIIFDYSNIAGSIATHAGLATVHQDAPAIAAGLIATHAGIAIAHQDAPGLIATHAGNANAHHTPPLATKEFWCPVTRATTISGNGDFFGGHINDPGDYACMNFIIPHDFTSLSEAVIVLNPQLGGGHRFDITTGYAASGEAYTTHAESMLDHEPTLVQWQLHEIDISSILSSIAADDYCGVKIVGDAVNTPDAMIIGFRLKYT